MDKYTLGSRYPYQYRYWDTWLTIRTDSFIRTFTFQVWINEQTLVTVALIAGPQCFSKLILLLLQSIVQVLPSKRLTLTNDGRRAGTRNRSKVQIIEKHLVRFLQFRKGDVHKWHHAILNNFWALPPASRVFITEAFMMSSHNPWPPPRQWRHLWTTP